MSGRVPFRRHPLHSERVPIASPPFFIIGSGRSGNTLLRTILVGNPTVCIPPESYVLGRVIRDYRLLRPLPWSILARLVVARFESCRHFSSWGIDVRGFHRIAADLPPERRDLANLLDGFYRHYAESKCPLAERWGDKTPLNTRSVHLIDDVFPRARYIHMIRDGRDVVSSYLQAGLYTRPEDACERWHDSVERARAFGAKIGASRYMEVFYEDLVRDPEPVTRRTCAFLDLEYLPGMLETSGRAAGLGDTRELTHHRNVHKPITTGSIGSWRRRLDGPTRKLVEERLAPTLSALRYPSGPVSPAPSFPPATRTVPPSGEQPPRTKDLRS